MFAILSAQLFLNLFTTMEKKFGMANIKSSKKDIVRSERHRQRNIAVRSRLRTYMKNAQVAIDAKNPDEVKRTLPAALSEIDRAVSKGVLHRNSAARKKSMLQRRATLLS